VNFQERTEAIASQSWLSEGHNLDLTFLATASNFDTRTNGATHMGNDDLLVFAQIAHLKIIDSSCPAQIKGIVKWVMEGNRGLVYLRMMRAPSAVIYGSDFVFEYGRGYVLKQGEHDRAIVVSSGRGVHEAMAASTLLGQQDVGVTVVDMPSIDTELFLSLYDSGKPLLVAEQNNGYIWSELRRLLGRERSTIDMSRLIGVNTLDENGLPQFIHSATYAQLLERFGLSPQQLARKVQDILG
jgi:transketolase C-terminal domain/subunit